MINKALTTVSQSLLVCRNYRQTEMTRHQLLLPNRTHMCTESCQVWFLGMRLLGSVKRSHLGIEQSDGGKGIPVGNFEIFDASRRCQELEELEDGVTFGLSSVTSSTRDNPPFSKGVGSKIDHFKFQRLSCQHLDGDRVTSVLSIELMISIMSIHFCT
jgi:hypothetical protein